MTREPSPTRSVGRLGVGELAELVEPLVQLSQAGLHELLPLERGLVLGVFPQVAQLDRLSDGLGQKDVQLVAELVDLPAQLLPHFTNHGADQTKEEYGLERDHAQGERDRRALKIPPALPKRRNA